MAEGVIWGCWASGPGVLLSALSFELLEEALTVRGQGGNRRG